MTALSVLVYENMIEQINFTKIWQVYSLPFEVGIPLLCLQSLLSEATVKFIRYDL